MTISIIKKILAASAAVALSGCNLTVQIKDGVGGSVVSNDNKINCPDAACSFNYEGFDKRVKLTAVADSGYKFAGFESTNGQLVCTNGVENSLETGVCDVVSDSPKTVVAVFEGETQSGSPRSLTSMSASNCGISAEDELLCWGSDWGVFPGDDLTLTNTWMADIAVWGGCAIDSGEVVCWGDESFSIIVGDVFNPPTLSNPRYIEAGYNSACAIDDNGISCWGAGGEDAHPIPAGIINPRKVVIGGELICALGDNGVTCWGSNQSGTVVAMPELSNPIDITAGGGHMCAIDDNGASCWGVIEDHQGIVPVGVNDPVEIDGAETADGYGVINSDGSISFWGRHTQELTDNMPTNLENPRELSVSQFSACVVDDSGVVCWGTNRSGQLDVPDGLKK